MQRLPGIKRKLAIELWNIGITSVRDLNGTDPFVLFDKLNLFAEKKHSKRILYNLHRAVYYASSVDKDPEKLTIEYWRNYLKAQK